MIVNLSNIPPPRFNENAIAFVIPVLGQHAQSFCMLPQFSTVKCIDYLKGRWQMDHNSFVCPDDWIAHQLQAF